MKTTLLITLAAFAAVAFGQAVVADDSMGNGHMMMNQSTPMMMSTMHQRIQMMQSQMDKIHATQNRRERTQLMNEHMRSLQQAMQMMGKLPQSNMQTETMGMGNGRAPMMQQCTDDSVQCRQLNQMADRQQHMQQRMDMMQMMMQQMLEHEAVGEKQDASK